MNCLAEECSETGVSVAKAKRFGLDDYNPNNGVNNKDHLISEIKDIICVAMILQREGILPEFGVTKEDVDAKLAKIEKYMKISVNNGTLSVDLEETFK